jgi:hypothetical protein
MSDKRQFKDIGARLRAERPSPSSGLISAIIARVPERVQRHPKASLRLALASALAVALVTAVTAVGGVSYATHQVSHAVTAVKSTVSGKSARPTAVSASSQYKGAPVITGFEPKAACVFQKVMIFGSNFIGTFEVDFGGIPAKMFHVQHHGDIIKAWVPDGFQDVAPGFIDVFTDKGMATSPHALKLKHPGCKGRHL